jgi:hypothetical protein
MLVVIFQVSVMMSQTNYAINQQKNINLKFNVGTEKVLCIKNKKTTFCLEQNGVGLPTVFSGYFVMRRMKVKLSFDIMPNR